MPTRRAAAPSPKPEPNATDANATDTDANITTLVQIRLQQRLPLTPLLQRTAAGDRDRDEPCAQGGAAVGEPRQRERARVLELRARPAHECVHFFAQHRPPPKPPSPEEVEALAAHRRKLEEAYRPSLGRTSTRCAAAHAPRDRRRGCGREHCTAVFQQRRNTHVAHARRLHETSPHPEHKLSLPRLMATDMLARAAAPAPAVPQRRDACHSPSASPSIVTTRCATACRATGDPVEWGFRSAASSPRRSRARQGAARGDRGVVALRPAQGRRGGGGDGGAARASGAPAPAQGFSTHASSGRRAPQACARQAPSATG